MREVDPQRVEQAKFYQRKFAYELLNRPEDSNPVIFWRNLFIATAEVCIEQKLSIEPSSLHDVLPARYVDVVSSNEDYRRWLHKGFSLLKPLPGYVVAVDNLEALDQIDMGELYYTDLEIADFGTDRASA